MNYKADLYIMLPCIQKEEIDFQTIDYKDGNLFKNELDKVAAYEFGTDLNSRIAPAMYRVKLFFHVKLMTGKTLNF